MKNNLIKQAERYWAILLMTALFSVVTSVSAIESITYYHNDLYGSPIATTDNDGNIKWQEQYKAYGKRHSDDAFSDDDNIGFTGFTEDEDAGLSYAQARWYNPALGRFTGIDPVAVKPQDIMSFNRYAYGNNNPYKYIDPEGEYPESVSMAKWSSGFCGACYRASSPSLVRQFFSDFGNGVGNVLGLMGSPNMVPGQIPSQIRYAPTTVQTSSSAAGFNGKKIGMSISRSGSGNIDVSANSGIYSMEAGQSGFDASVGGSFLNVGAKFGINSDGGIYTSVSNNILPSKKKGFTANEGQVTRTFFFSVVPFVNYATKGSQ